MLNVLVDPTTRSRRDTWAHAARLLRTESFPNIFPQKTHSTPMTMGRDKTADLTLRDLALSWWIGAQFFDAGEICESRLHIVTCLASLYVGKQHWTNNEPQKPNKLAMNWAQVTQKRQQQAQVYVSTTHFYVNFMPIFVRFILNFSHSLKIVRNMQNRNENRGNLCTEFGAPSVSSYFKSH